MELEIMFLTNYIFLWVGASYYQMDTGLGCCWHHQLTNRHTSVVAVPRVLSAHQLRRYFRLHNKEKYYRIPVVVVRMRFLYPTNNQATRY